MSYIMVLEDGETYTQLSGCKIVWINQDVVDEGAEEDVLKELELSVFVGRCEVVTEFK